jgi:hypothetical protein
MYYERRFTMSGQPVSFDFAKIIPIEVPGVALTAPFVILQDGDQITLRTYFHCGGSLIDRFAVSSALAGAGAAAFYYFDDLEAGGTPIKVPGGAITKLTATDITNAFAPPTATTPPGDLFGSGLPQTDDYYLSADTTPITTGAGNTLQIPAGNNSGTWRVLTFISGGGGTPVSAFDDNLFVQVLA